MSQSQTASVPFSKKRWPKVIAVLVLLVVGFLVALPYAVRYSLERWLVNNGAQSAEIQKVRLNLFAGTAAIDGLQVKLHDDVTIADENLHLDFKLSSLFKKEGYLETGTLSGLILDIELNDNGALRIGSISIFPSSSEETEEPAPENDAGWLFRASHVELKDCLVRFTMPKLQKTIHIDHAVLSNITTGSSSQPSHLELQGRINDAPLSLELDRIDLSSGVVVGGHIKVDDYRLGYLQKLLEIFLDPFAGSISLDGKIQFSLSDEEEIAAKYEGTINAVETDIGSPDFSTKSPSVTYKGTVQYEQDADINIVIDVDGILQGEDVAVGVPPANLDLLEKQLQLKGKTRVSITDGVAVVTDADLSSGDFALNLPGMKVNESGLDWQGHVEYRMEGGSDRQTIITDGKFAIRKPAYSFDSKGFSLHTDTKQASWQGKVDIDLGIDDEPITILVDGLMNGDNHQLTIPELLELKEDSFLADGETRITIGRDIKVSHESRQLQIDNTSVAIAGTTSSSGSLSWQGQSDYLLATGNTSVVSLDGTLKGTNLATMLEEQKIRIQQQDLNLTAHKAQLKIGKQIKFGGKASLLANKLQVESDDSPLILLEKTAVQGLTGTADGGLRVDTVTLSNLEVPATESQPIGVSVPEITLKNLASADFTGATVDTLHIKNSTVLDSQSKTLLAKVDTITGSKIKVEQPLKVSLDSLTTSKGAFLTKNGKKAKPEVTLNKLKAGTIAWSLDEGFFCDKITLDALQGKYTRVKSPAGKKKKAASKQKQKKEKTAPPPVTINTIAVTGKSGFQFIDKATSVPFQTALVLETVKINNIDFSKPKTPFTYKVKGKFDNYAPLDISGSCAPFGKKFLIESKIHLRNYSLEKLSPYVIDAIGTKFVKGQLNVTSDLKISGGKLDLKNNLVFQQGKSETVSEEMLAKLNNELPVPLDMALTMLRDNKGDIDLNVPVSGPLNHLSVNPTDILVTALSKAIAVSVTPYLAYTVLGPAGALAYVGLKVGQAVIDADLPHLEFAEGESELTDGHKEILKGIGKKIKKDKDQDYSICSRALIWEVSGNVKRDAQTQQKILKDNAARKELRDIADKRAQNVHGYLLDNFSIKEDNLLICEPGINFEPKGKPTVGFRK
ncbi:MAG: DUF748 domain-containing protein [Thermodesulfobacteriota bacterium]|nr:DUF748 domain-containing protein [Thermodesulfobacteriota bacterium]